MKLPVGEYGERYVLSLTGHQRPWLLYDYMSNISAPWRRKYRSRRSPRVLAKVNRGDVRGGHRLLRWVKGCAGWWVPNEKRTKHGIVRVHTYIIEQNKHDTRG